MKIELDVDELHIDDTVVGAGTEIDPIRVSHPLSSILLHPTLTGDGINTPISVTNPGITEVVVDSTLSGNGTLANPLTNPFPSITGINIENSDGMISIPEVTTIKFNSPIIDNGNGQVTVDNAQGGGSITISDGQTTVQAVTAIDFPMGSVIDNGNNTATIDIQGGGGGITLDDNVSNIPGVTKIYLPENSLTDEGGGTATLNISASPAGQANQIQFNQFGSFSASKGLTFQQILDGFNFKFETTVGSTTFDSGSGGTLKLGAYAGSDNRSYITARNDLEVNAKNINVLGGSSGDGEGVIGIGNVVIPPQNVPNGGALYVENGALMFKGGNGTVTVIAPA